MSLVQHSIDGGVVTIGMDDGKANALSNVMQAEIGSALDRAEDDDVKAVVLAGRPGRFSGGFDLGVLNAGGPDAVTMLRGGFELAERLLTFPKPVVIACTGHAIAMASFLLLSTDYRVGAVGEFRIQANEVAIGLILPYPAITLLRGRLTTPAFDRAVGLAESFSPEEAVAAGFLDRVVEPEQVVTEAQAAAASFTALDPGAHVASKLRARAALLAELRAGIESDFP